MATSAKDQAAKDTGEWKVVHHESDQVVIFDTPGDQFTGTYLGRETITPDNAEAFDRLRFTGADDGQPYAINPSYQLDDAFSDIAVGTLCRITLVKMIPNKKNPAYNDLKDFRVETRD